MEKLITKTRILIWAVIALVIFNLATIATIFFHQREKDFAFLRRPGRPEVPAPLGGRIIKERLHLNEEQMAQFKKFNMQFRDSSKNIMIQMHEMRSNMMECITSPNPDTVEFNRLNLKLGQMHVTMKKNLVDFYFNLRSICDKQQQEILSVSMREMLENEGTLPDFLHNRHIRFHKMKEHVPQPPKPE